MNNVDRLRWAAQEDGMHGFVKVRIYDLREILRKYDNSRSVNRRLHEHSSLLCDEIKDWGEDVSATLGKKKLDANKWPALGKLVSFLDSTQGGWK